MTEVRGFLDLVHYLNAFLPKLAVQSEILSCLTTKGCEKEFPLWTDNVFDRIKEIVVLHE